MLWIISFSFLAVFLFALAFLLALRGRFFQPERQYLKRWIGPEGEKKPETPATSVERKEFDDEAKFIRGILGKSPRLHNFYRAIRYVHPKLTIGRFFAICAAIVAANTLLFYVFSRVPFFPSLVLGLAIGAGIPLLYVRFRHRRRMDRFSEFLPDALRMLIGALRAGYGVSGGFEMVAQDGPPPLNEEFRTILAELELGLSMETALYNLVERVQTRDTEFFTMAILLQKETGGNLAELMEGLETTIRDRQRIRREAKALMAQGKMSSYALTLMPVLIAVGVIVGIPRYSQILLQTHPGHMMLLSAVVLELLGFLLVKKITQVPIN